MSHAGGARSGGPDEQEHDDRFKAEFARVLGKHVKREVAASPVRRVAGRQLRTSGESEVVRLENHVVDAITLAIDDSIERLLPGLLEDAVARVLPDALDAAITEIVEALSSPDPDSAWAAEPPAHAARYPRETRSR